MNDSLGCSAGKDLKLCRKVSDATFTPQTGEWKDNTAPAKENVTRESSDGTQIKTSVSTNNFK